MTPPRPPPALRPTQVSLATEHHTSHSNWNTYGTHLPSSRRAIGMHDCRPIITVPYTMPVHSCEPKDESQPGPDHDAGAPRIPVALRTVLIDRQGIHSGSPRSVDFLPYRNNIIYAISQNVPAVINKCLCFNTVSVLSL